MPITLPVDVNGALTLSVNGLGGPDTITAFNGVAVNDLLLFELGGQSYRRKVTAHASDDSITVDQAITIPTTGAAFAYKKFWQLADPQDGWIAVGPSSLASFTWTVDANASTGGVVAAVDCTPPSTPYVVATSTVATGTTGNGFFAIDLTKIQFELCRLRFKFGTGDDADAAPEQISAGLGLRR